MGRMEKASIELIRSIGPIDHLQIPSTSLEPALTA